MPEKKQIVKANGRELTLSNVDKIFYPESGFTKGDVIAFYDEIADVMNCPIGTVRSRIFRAREAIATELRPLLGTEENRRW
jgi:DNA primase